MAFCLPKFAVDKFIKSLPEDPTKLVEMTSEARRNFFKESVGEGNAQQVNALFESKLLLKNQQQGLINWVNKVANLKPEVKRDLISRVNRMTEVLTPENTDMFLQDLVEQRLGVSVSAEEAAQIATLSKNVSDSLAKISENSPNNSIEKINYGTNLVLFKNYISDLKSEAITPLTKDYITNPIEVVREVAGTSKALNATFDNSFPFRQGWPVLFTHPTIWAKTFLKTFSNIGKTLIGKDVLLPTKAEIYSRTNAINNLYTRSKLAIGIATEENFPKTKLIELIKKTPILNRVYNASEVAYNAAALKLRADLADYYFKLAEDSGVNLGSKMEVESIGTLVNSLTGRGSLGKFEPAAGTLNTALFSPRFVKANVDVLTAHLFSGKKISPFVRKRAAINLFKIAGGVTATLMIADQLSPGSVEWDPRSTNFGKIKYDNSWIDITGGFRGLIILGARQFTGETKTSKGKIESLESGKFGAQTRLSVATDFMLGKASPLAGVIRDKMKGQFYGGDKFTWSGALKKLLTPIPAQTAQSILESKDLDNIIQLMILEGLGISVTPPKGKK